MPKFSLSDLVDRWPNDRTKLTAALEARASQADATKEAIAESAWNQADELERSARDLMDRAAQHGVEIPVEVDADWQAIVGGSHDFFIEYGYREWLREKLAAGGLTAAEAQSNAEWAERLVIEAAARRLQRGEPIQAPMGHPSPDHPERHDFYLPYLLTLYRESEAGGRPEPPSLRLLDDEIEIFEPGEHVELAREAAREARDALPPDKQARIDLMERLGWRHGAVKDAARELGVSENVISKTIAEYKSDARRLLSAKRRDRGLKPVLETVPTPCRHFLDSVDTTDDLEAFGADLLAGRPTEQTMHYASCSRCYQLVDPKLRRVTTLKTSLTELGQAFAQDVHVLNEVSEEILLGTTGRPSLVVPTVVADFIRFGLSELDAEIIRLWASREPWDALVRKGRAPFRASIALVRFQILNNHFLEVGDA